MTEMIEIRTNAVLPAERTNIDLRTSDGLTLVGELAVPRDRAAVATLVTLHPLPTQGGFMDSHVLRKAAARLPALADLAVLRFNTRGTRSPRGLSEGQFDGGDAERADVGAAMDFVAEHRLPKPWLVGWSFGTELALKYGADHPVEGIILLSPPLHRTSPEELRRWDGDPRRVLALVPENDMFLRPAEAEVRFAAIGHAQVVSAPGAKHLWVGEQQVRWVLNQIVSAVNPAAVPLPTQWPCDSTRS